MIRSNEHKINALFTALLLAVQAALQASSDVTVDNVRDFLIMFFKQDFPTTANVKDLLQRVTLKNYWSYHNYSPLEQLINHFLPGNKDVGRLMTDYKARLSGFYLTTKIIDYMDYKNQLSTSDSPDLSPPKLLPGGASSSYSYSHTVAQ